MYNQSPELMMALANERIADLQSRAHAESPRFAWFTRRQRSAPEGAPKKASLTRRKAY